jgi:hypothetical protein
MSKSKSSDTFSNGEQSSQTQDLSVYDVMDALLGAKAAALQLLKFKRHLPAEGLDELKELTRELTRAIHAAACGDLGDVPVEIRRSTLLLTEGV